MSSQWYCCIASQQYGPFPFEQLQQWVAEGRLQPDHHVCIVGQQQWTVVRNVPELFGQPSNSGHYPPHGAAASYPQSGYSQSPTPASETGFQIKTGPTSYAATSKAKRDRSLQFAGAVFAGILAVLACGARVARIVLRNHEANERREQVQRQENQQLLRQRQMISEMSRPPQIRPPGVDLDEIRARAKRTRQPGQ